MRCCSVKRSHDPEFRSLYSCAILHEAFFFVWDCFSCVFALLDSGTNLRSSGCDSVLIGAAYTCSLPSISAWKPCSATCAGSWLILLSEPSAMSSIPARWKKSEPVEPGCRAVTVIPVSFSSYRKDLENDRMNAFDAPYTASNGAATVPATDDVKRI